MLFDCGFFSLVLRFHAQNPPSHAKLFSYFMFYEAKAKLVRGLTVLGVIIFGGPPALMRVNFLALAFGSRLDIERQKAGQV